MKWNQFWILTYYYGDLDTEKWILLSTLYLSATASGPGGVEVEAERGGSGGFSSSPSITENEGDSDTQAFTLYTHAATWTPINTWVVPVVADGRLLPVHGVKQRRHQTLVRLQVQQHQLLQCLEPLGLHALGRLRERGRRATRRGRDGGKNFFLKRKTEFLGFLFQKKWGNKCLAFKIK